MATAPLRPSLGLAAPAAPRTAKQGAGAGGHAFAAALEGLGGLGWPPLKSAVREHAAGATAKRSAGEAEREAAGDLLHLAQGTPAAHTLPEQPRSSAPRAAKAGPSPTPPVSTQQAAPQPPTPQQAASGKEPVRPSVPSLAAPAQGPVVAVAAHGAAIAQRTHAAAPAEPRAPSTHTAGPVTAPAPRVGGSGAGSKPTAADVPARVAAPSPRAAQRAAFESKHGGAEDTGHEQAAAPRKHASRVHASGHEPSLVQAAPPPAQPAAQSAPPTPQQAAAPQHAGSGATALPPSLAASVEADDSLRLVVLPNSANLRVTTPNGGDLSVHLRVRDGVTNVTVSGAGSEAAMAHSSDLRAALAGQGLALGRIERTTASAAGAAEVAGPRARVRSGERGEGRSAPPSRTDESVNLVATEELARPLQ